MSLPLPLGHVDAVIEAADDTSFVVRCTDVQLGLLVEFDATLDQLAEWQRDGGSPDDLAVRRWPLADRIAGLRAWLDQLHARREGIEREWPGIADGEWTE